jgi:CRP-like cAMP-binding protein
MSLDVLIAQLQKTPPFDALPRDALQLVAFSAEERKLASGEVLFEQGEAADAGYFILSGSITLSISGQGAPRARVARAGALIGEAALLTSMERAARATATEKTGLLRIPRQVFQRVLAEFPNDAAKLRAKLAQRTRTLVKDLDALRLRALS